MALSQASNWYYMDGEDLYDTYGVVVTTSNDAFLYYPTLKEPLGHDYRDKTGKEYDLSTPNYQTREAILKVWMIASSEVDFWTKYKAFWAKLSAPGARALQIVELGQTFDVFYRKTESVSRLTRIKNTSKVGVTMELRFEIINGGYILAGDGSFYYGPVTAFPTTWEQVQALPYSQQEGSGNQVTMHTGTTATKFCIAMRTARTLTRVIDLNASNSNLTGQYSQRAVINGYTVRGLSQSIPYSLNHVHLFTIE